MEEPTRQSAAAEEARNEGEEAVAKAQSLMDRVTASPDRPSPALLHALSSLLETQESRYPFCSSLRALRACGHSIFCLLITEYVGFWAFPLVFGPIADTWNKAITPPIMLAPLIPLGVSAIYSV